MRLFIAVDVPESIKTALADMFDRWHANGGSLRFQRASKLHVTLRFLGEHSEEGKDELVKRLCAVRCEPFLTGLQGLGTFNDRGGYPRVLWAGVGIDKFRQLKAVVDRTLGYDPVSAESYNPHLTLSKPIQEEYGEVVSFVGYMQHELPRDGWLVDAVKLYHRPVEGGEYQELAVVRLLNQPKQLALL